MQLPSAASLQAAAGAQATKLAWMAGHPSETADFAVPCRPIRSLEARQAQLLQAELPLPQGSLAEMARADDTDLLEWDRVKADEEDAEGECQ